MSEKFAFYTQVIAANTMTPAHISYMSARATLIAEIAMRHNIPWEAAQIDKDEVEYSFRLNNLNQLEAVASSLKEYGLDGMTLDYVAADCTDEEILDLHKSPEIQAVFVLVDM